MRRESYLRLIDSCITPLKAQGPSRTCNESKKEKKKGGKPEKNAPISGEKPRNEQIDETCLIVSGVGV